MRVCMRIHMQIFFLLFLIFVWKGVKHFWPQKKLQFSQELKNLVQFAQLSEGSTIWNDYHCETYFDGDDECLGCWVLEEDSA